MDRLPSVGAMPGESQKPMINCNPICMRFMNPLTTKFRLTRIETMMHLMFEFQTLSIQLTDQSRSNFQATIMHSEKVISRCKLPQVDVIAVAAFCYPVSDFPVYFLHLLASI